MDQLELAFRLLVSLQFMYFQYNVYLYKHCGAHIIIIIYTVVPLMRDHKESPQKWSLKRGLPYLVGNQELKPLVPLPNYPPNKANPF